LVTWSAGELAVAVSAAMGDDFAATDLCCGGVGELVFCCMLAAVRAASAAAAYVGLFRDKVPLNKLILCGAEVDGVVGADTTGAGLAAAAGICMQYSVLQRGSQTVPPLALALALSASAADRSDVAAVVKSSLH
jgi:hypothetical protein